MHRATPEFLRLVDALPTPVQRVARRNFDLLKADPRHPSLQFKKVGEFWSARVGRSYRALATEDGGDFTWVWIGNHDDYTRMIRA